MSIRSLKRGFTLIELLLVIGIIAILAAIVIVAINPTKQLGDARNAQRRADVNTILNAAYQYSIDNSTVGIPASITTTDTFICKSGSASCTGFIDLSVLTASGKYIVALPVDPRAGADEETGYKIKKDANGRIVVSAPNAENTTISVTR